MERAGTIREGIRAGVPLFVPTALVGVSFGVLADPVFGGVGSVVMSLVVYAGSAQFGALAVLAAGGGAVAAIVTGILLNARFLALGIAVAPWLRGGRLQRAAEGQTVVDASWALAHRGEGVFDRQILIGATLPQYVAWSGGTLAGVLGGELIGDPAKLGLDALFPAFFLALLAGELRNGEARWLALGAALVTLALLPWAPAGVPVLAGPLVVLTRLRTRRP